MCAFGMSTQDQGINLIRTEVEKINPNNQAKPHSSMLCMCVPTPQENSLRKTPVSFNPDQFLHHIAA